MDLTMNSTITELSLHACNFVLKVLHRDEPGARVPLFTLVTQLSKLVEKNLAYCGLLNFWNKNFMPL